MKKILLTGATGFVGSRLVKALTDNGYNVSIITRPSSSLKELRTISNQYCTYVYNESSDSIMHAIHESMPDIVIHLASLFVAEHNSSQITDLVNSNILFGTQLLEAMNKYSVKKLINTGTSWQHYNNEAYNPVNLYAATKQAFANLIEYYVQACDFSVITLKLFDIYGPDDPREKIVPLLNKIAQSQESLDMSPGEQKINLVHIQDVCSAYLHAISLLVSDDNCIRHNTYAVASDEILSLKELVEKYERINKCKLNINWGKRQYRAREVMSLWDKYECLPGWSQDVTLADGLFCKSVSYKQK